MMSPAPSSIANLIRMAPVGNRSGPVSLGLLIVVAGAGVALSQNRPEEKPPAAVAEPDERTLALRDEIEIATARVQAKRAEVRVAENRLARVRAVVATMEAYYKQKVIPESNLAVARLDALEHEGLLEMRQAELKEREVRLAALQRALSRGATPAPGLTSAPDDLPLRLDWVERRLGAVEEQAMILKRVDYSRPRP